MCIKKQGIIKIKVINTKNKVINNIKGIKQFI